MSLYLIGLGLGNHKDITVKGLEVVKSSEEIYLESYTSCLGVKKEELEKFYEKEITELWREDVEYGADDMLDKIKENPDKHYSFLVIGDPLCATTHIDIYYRALKKGIKVEVIHNASIMNAVGCCGLHVYDFGATISMCFFTETWKPMSWYNKVLANR